MIRERILVVDDEPAMLRSVERCLAARYEVATARTAADALEKIEELQPHLAIVDIRMPDIDGFELVGQLRNRRERLEVIFMTGIVHEFDAQLIRAIREKAFYFIQKPFDREVLLTLVGRCLEVRRLADREREHVSRLESELQEARAFQRSMLPPESACFNGLRIDTCYRPCEAMSGDFFDYVDAGNGRTTVLIADVSGHGVGAAMLVGIVKSAFHDAHVDDFEPCAVVDRIASGIRSFDDGRFVTVFCGRFDTRAGLLEYVNAGHPTAVLWGGPDRQLLKLSGPMISPAFEDVAWETRRQPLGAADQLLLYTDGITESRGDEGMFGTERLLELLRETPLSGGPLLEEIVERVTGFCGGRPAEDDLTLMTVGLAGE